MRNRGETDVGPLLAEAAKRLPCEERDVNWFAWPEVFGSTAGPRSGIGGQALTTFQVFGFQGYEDDGLLYCAGIWKPWKNLGELAWDQRRKP